MNIEPYLVSTAISGVIAQRLIKKICPHCKYEYNATEYEKKILQNDTSTAVKLYKGNGCGHCNYTGYLGRTGIYEIMEISREHRDYINISRDPNILKDISIKNGMETLEENCKKLVLKGTTTVNELASITMMKNI